MESKNKIAEQPSTLSISPNLINKESNTHYDKTKSYQSINKSIKILFLTTEIFTVLLIAYNIKLGNDLKKIDTLVQKKVNESLKSGGFEKTILDLNQKLSFYARIKAENPKMQDKLELVYKATPEEILVNKLSLEGNSIKMELFAPQGKDFAKFITSYLETKQVKEIVLNGANLNPETQEYTFNIEVVMLEKL